MTDLQTPPDVSPDVGEQAGSGDQTRRPHLAVNMAWNWAGTLAETVTAFVVAPLLLGLLAVHGQLLPTPPGRWSAGRGTAQQLTTMRRCCNLLPLTQPPGHQGAVVADRCRPCIRQVRIRKLVRNAFCYFGN